MEHLISTGPQLGRLLQSARRAAGLSQTDLAARIGVSQSRLSAMEIQPESIRAEQLLALAGALGLELVMRPVHPPDTAAGTAVEW